MPYGTALLWYADTDSELGKEVEKRLLLKGVGVSSNDRLYTVSPLALSNARYVIVIMSRNAAADDDAMAVCEELIASAVERKTRLHVARRIHGGLCRIQPVHTPAVCR